MAYVAHRLISEVSSDCLWDYQEHRYVRFGGSISLAKVMVFDNDRGCYITGKIAGTKIPLFHFGESSRLTLEIMGDSFCGFDFATSRQFTGSLEGRLIRLFDQEDYSQHIYGF